MRFFLGGFAAAEVETADPSTALGMTRLEWWLSGCFAVEKA